MLGPFKMNCIKTDLTFLPERFKRMFYNGTNVDEAKEVYLYIQVLSLRAGLDTLDKVSVTPRHLSWCHLAECHHTIISECEALANGMLYRFIKGR